MTGPAIAPLGARSAAARADARQLPAPTLSAAFLCQRAKIQQQHLQSGSNIFSLASLFIHTRSYCRRHNICQDTTSKPQLPVKMEGPTISSGKLRFTESRRKFRVTQNVGPSPSHKLIAAANNHKLVIIGFEDETIKAIELGQLLDFTPAKERAEIMDLNQFVFEIKLTFRPTLLTVACYGYSSVLLVCGQKNLPQCPVIEAFDLDTRNSIGKVELTDLVGSNLIDYAWSPNFFDSIVALCSNQGHLIVVAIDRPRAISVVYQNQHYGALSCCWSPKGKNLAVGQSNGRIIRLEPQISNNTFTFKEVDKSTLIFSHQKMTPNHQVIKLRWINKNFLIAIHACPSNMSGPETIYSIITVKPSKPYRYWTNLCYENSTSQNYTTHIVNLSNAIICSSNVSGEAAVLGVDDAAAAVRNDLEDWKSITVDEEGARVELPLDRNNRETNVLSVTLSQTEHPIILIYSSDGVVIAYAALHADSIFKLPEFQPKQGCPIELQRSAATQSGQSIFQTTSQPSSQPSNLFALSAQPSSLQAQAPQPTSLFAQATKPSSIFSRASQQPNLFAQATQPSNIFGQAPQPSNLFAKAIQPTSIFGQAPPPAGLPAQGTQPSNLFAQATQPLSFSSQAPSLSSLSIQAPLESSSPSQASQALSKPAQAPQPTTLAPQPSSLPPQIPQQPIMTSLAQQQTITRTSQPAKLLTQIAQPSTLTNQVPQPTILPNQFAQLSTQPNLVPQPSVMPSRAPQQVRLSVPNHSQPASLLAQTPEASSVFKEVKSGIDSNKKSIEVFDEINGLRARFDEILDIHKSLRDVLDVSSETIESLTVQMLDNFYLIEHIKIHNKDGSKKRTVDKLTLDKVDSVRKKSKNIDLKLKELDSIVEMAWEDFNRRKSNSGSKIKQLRSLDLIYRSLATNQKIINVLKTRTAENVAKSPVAKKPVDYKSEPIVPIRKELDPVRLRHFKEFLSSRDVAPIRRPD